MTFVSEFHPKAKKFIDSLDKTTRNRILDAVNKLEIDPFPRGCIKIEGSISGYESEKIFRTRVGDYRILYVIKPEERRLIFVRIDKRGRAYK